MEELQGIILRIEKSSIFDGGGLRTVVFLKGCPLSCAWCSTPESQSAEIESVPEETYGSQMSVSQVMEEIEKDRIFFFHSNGGVTISGGEPLVQADFLQALLKECKFIGLNTAMETSLSMPYSEVLKVVPFLDTIYADIKFIDCHKHRLYCGQENTMILQNIQRLAAEKQPHKIIIRVPLITGINDSDDELSSIADFCNQLQYINGIELLPYHRLGIGTYEKLGRTYMLKDVRPPSPEDFQERREFFKNRVANAKVL